jgi:hypothetical protein
MNEKDNNVNTTDNNNCIKNEDYFQTNIEPNNKQRKGRYGKKVKKEDNNDFSRPGKRGKTNFQFDGETVNKMILIFFYIFFLFCFVLFCFVSAYFIFIIFLSSYMN